MLEEKQKIPTNIKVFDLNGKEVTLKDYLGEPLVIYFYPEDNTPGCTKEAKSFRDFKNKIKQAGAKIIGVSKDSVSSHRDFTKRYDLNFELLSDPEHELIEAFGLLQQKREFNQTIYDTVRATFVVDRLGQVVKVWPRVTPANHGREIYQFIDNQFEVDASD
jgi:peroxiredoxin Q/BCP